MTVASVPSIFPEPERRGERSATARDPRFDGADRDVQCRCDLGVVEVGDITEDHRDSQVVGQSIECVVEDESIGKRIGVAIGGRVDEFGPVVLVDGVERGAALSFAEFIERRVGGDAVGPGAERRTAVEARQAPNDLDQGLLAGVIGVAGTPGDTTADRVDTVVVATQQLVERESGAGVRGGDQGSIVEVARNAWSVPNVPGA